MVTTMTTPTAAPRTRSVSSFVLPLDHPATWRLETTTTAHRSARNAGTFAAMARVVPFVTTAFDLRPITTGAAKQAAPPRGVPR